MMTTIKQAKDLLRPHSIVLAKRDDEYRVNFNGGREETAYYTNDIDDAVATGIAMSKLFVAPTNVKPPALALDYDDAIINAARIVRECEARAERSVVEKQNRKGEAFYGQ